MGRALFTLALLLGAAGGGCAKELPQHPPVTLQGDKVRIPLEQVADGKVHFFTFRHGGKRVNFLIRTDGEGRLHAALDACYGCYQYRLGYRATGEALVCRACLLEFALADETWDYIGPCAPIPLAHKEEAGFLTITLSRLEKAARYF